MRIKWNKDSKPYETSVLITDYFSGGGYGGRSIDYDVSTRGRNITDLANNIIKKVHEKLENEKLAESENNQ